MNYIILDLEATCWEEKGQHQSEIIEIGAIKISDNQQVLEEFDAFIKPLLNPVLSEFCTKLTSIKQEQIDAAQGFPEVVEQFKNWIRPGTDFYLCSWGFYDKNQFVADCGLHKIDTAWLKNHMSIKHQYAGQKKLKHPVGLGYAINNEGMKFEGKAHRGIDDARNISRIFLKYFKDWKIIGMPK